MLDLRTVFPRQDQQIVDALFQLYRGNRPDRDRPHDRHGLNRQPICRVASEIRNTRRGRLKGRIFAAPVEERPDSSRPVTANQACQNECRLGRSFFPSRMDLRPANRYSLPCLPELTCLAMI